MHKGARLSVFILKAIRTALFPVLFIAEAQQLGAKRSPFSGRSTENILQELNSNSAKTGVNPAWRIPCPLCRKSMQVNLLKG
jgi:hypothetical protein